MYGPPPRHVASRITQGRRLEREASLGYGGGGWGGRRGRGYAYADDDGNFNIGYDGYNIGFRRHHRRDRDDDRGRGRDRDDRGGDQPPQDDNFHGIETRLGTLYRDAYALQQLQAAQPPDPAAIAAAQARVARDGQEYNNYLDRVYGDGTPGSGMRANIDVPQSITVDGHTYTLPSAQMTPEQIQQFLFNRENGMMIGVTPSDPGQPDPRDGRDRTTDTGGDNNNGNGNDQTVTPTPYPGNGQTVTLDANGITAANVVQVLAAGTVKAADGHEMTPKERLTAVLTAINGELTAHPPKHDIMSALAADPQALGNIGGLYGALNAQERTEMNAPMIQMLQGTLNNPDIHLTEAQRTAIQQQIAGLQQAQNQNQPGAANGQGFAEMLRQFFTTLIQALERAFGAPGQSTDPTQPGDPTQPTQPSQAFLSALGQVVFVSSADATLQTRTRDQGTDALINEGMTAASITGGINDGHITGAAEQHARDNLMHVLDPEGNGVSAADVAAFQQKLAQSGLTEQQFLAIVVRDGVAPPSATPTTGTKAPTVQK